MKNSILLMIIFSMELFASSTMMMPQKENRDDGKIVIGGSVSTQTGYQAPRLNFSENTVLSVKKIAYIQPL